MKARHGRFLLVAAFFLPLLSAFSLGLVSFRVSHTGYPTFTFLAWNLALAWCPVVLAGAIYVLHRTGLPTVALAVVAAVWLLFLPNAPYLVTDFIHVRIADGRLQMFDAFLLATFAINGVALGYVSTFLVHVVARERLGGSVAWLLISGSIAASAVGIYLGRVLRLNSWDAIQDPMLIPRLLRERAEDPFGNPDFIAMVSIGSVLLFVGYAISYWGGRRLSGPSSTPQLRPRRRPNA